jgi:hypothetical protein
VGGGGLADGDVARAFEDRLLHLADGLGDADLAGAGLGAVEDRASVDLYWRGGINLRTFV